MIEILNSKPRASNVITVHGKASVSCHSRAGGKGSQTRCTAFGVPNPVMSWLFWTPAFAGVTEGLGVHSVRGSNDQNPKSQTKSASLARRFGHWCFGFVWDLALGIWSLSLGNSVASPDKAERSPCAAEGEEKRDNTQGLEGSTCTTYTTPCTIPVPYNAVKQIFPPNSE
jgi:hypothetical protein